jgi:hypothetical protein
MSLDDSAGFKWRPPTNEMHIGTVESFANELPKPRRYSLGQDQPALLMKYCVEREAKSGVSTVIRFEAFQELNRFQEWFLVENGNGERWCRTKIITACVADAHWSG